MTTSPLVPVLDALMPAITNRSYWSDELDVLRRWAGQPGPAQLPEHENQFALNFSRATFARWLQRVRPLQAQEFWALIECGHAKGPTCPLLFVSLAQRFTFAAAFAGFARILESEGFSYEDAADIVLAGEHAYSVAERLCRPGDVAWLRDTYLPRVGIPIGGGKAFVTNMRVTILSELHQALQEAFSPQLV